MKNPFGKSRSFFYIYNITFCASENIAMTPYSTLASRRLSRNKDGDSKRLYEDTYVKFKNNQTGETDAFCMIFAFEAKKCNP